MVILRLAFMVAGIFFALASHFADDGSVTNAAGEQLAAILPKLAPRTEEDIDALLDCQLRM